MRRLLQFTLILYGLGLVLVAGWHWVRATDGQEIAWVLFISDQDGNDEIYRMHPDGSQQENLTHSWGNESNPQFSVDGKWIYFVYEEYNYQQIYRMRVDGSRRENLTNSYQTNLTPSLLGDSNPIFSRDGKWIFFEVHEYNDIELYRMRPDGSHREKLTDLTVGANFSLQTLHISDWVFFISTDFSSGSEIYQMRLDGTQKQNLSQSWGG
jgi:Tol biopolymer transport system component